MPALNQSQFKQLKMFMTSEEIVNEYQPAEGDRGWRNKSGPESDSEVWNRKRKEATANGLTESIQKHGVVYPVNIGTNVGNSGKRQVTGGHHRIAGALGTGKYLPVTHHEG